MVHLNTALAKLRACTGSNLHRSQNRWPCHPFDLFEGCSKGFVNGPTADFCKFKPKN